jgi:hypothetical protein
MLSFGERKFTDAEILNFSDCFAALKFTVELNTLCHVTFDLKCEKHHAVEQTNHEHIEAC